MIFLESEKKYLMRFANYVSSNYDEENKLWKMAERGFLYALFKADKSSGCEYLLGFDKIIKKVIEENLKLSKIMSAALESEGGWLCYDPELVMFDGLVEQESNGFFDSGDLPPPEFWIEYEERILISFIPKKFLDKAKVGVEYNMGGSLYWLDESQYEK